MLKVFHLLATPHLPAMRLAPRLWTIITILSSLLGPAADLACAEEVDPALLDACPGYNATSVKFDGNTLTAKLVLAGAPCNVFGNDIKALDLTVVYDVAEAAAGQSSRPGPPDQEPTARGPSARCVRC